MKTYAYKGFDQAGHNTQGLIEALDIKEAREKLARQGVLPRKLSVAGAEKPSRMKKPVFGGGDRSLFYREMAHLLRAGLALSPALEVLIESPETGNNREILAGIRDDLRDGQSVAVSIETHAPQFSAFEKSVIQAGERSGALEHIFDRLADFLEEDQQLREKVVTVSIYPSVILLLSIVVSGVIFGVLLPSFAKMMTDARIPVPPLTAFMMGVGEFLSLWGLPILVLLAVGLWLGARKVRQDADWRLRFNRALFRWPVTGKAYTALVNLRFSRTLGLLLDGGVPLVEALILAGHSTGSAWVGKSVEEESERVRQGESIADSLARVPPLSGSLPGWIRAGEAGGNLPTLLGSAGDRFQQVWDRSVSRALTLVEPILILVVGLFVLLLALAILMPMLSLNEGLAL